MNKNLNNTEIISEMSRFDDSPDAPNDPSFDEFDQNRCVGALPEDPFPRNGHVRDALMNTAVD